MGVRSLKDLDKIQEKGSILLSARRARSLVLAAGCLVVVAFLVGLQVGRSLAPVEGKVVAQDVASADRTIEEILAAYRAEGQRPEPTITAEAAPQSPPEPPQESPDEPVTDEPVTAEPEVVAEVAVQQETVQDVVEHPFADLPGPQPAGGYAVQLAAFPSAAEAAALASGVESSGASVYTMQVQVRGETWHRVRVGRFSRRADAQAWLPALTELTPFEPIVVTE